ncbi:hypothetical protein [Streptomyces sp. NBC_01190]|uniref:hypothetical protein n=1 Tax=Streptomyces sp. NBC_01190 TaxID=2903767 RepID=UPI00386FB046|nr:hypothetical protein OG519_28890 [Streptomyces sp. NBC_01190]
MRRAAGTRSALQVWLSWIGIQRRSPEGDCADLDAGETLIVAAHSKSIGGQSTPRTMIGALHLTAGRAPLWGRGQIGTKQRVTLAPPLSLEGEGEKVPLMRKFRRYILVTGDGSYDVALPEADAVLVRHALGTVDVNAVTVE